MSEPTSDPNVATAAEIVKAYLVNHAMTTDEVITWLRRVHAELANLANGEASVSSEPFRAPLPPPTSPKVSVKKSITANYLICLDCGAPLKMLKRHLLTHHNLTVPEYRTRWNLPESYPTTAANYSLARSDMAKARDFGRKKAR